MEDYSEKVGLRIIDAAHLQPGSACNSKGCALNEERNPRPVYLVSSRVVGAGASLAIHDDLFKPDQMGAEAPGHKFKCTLDEQFLPSKPRMPDDSAFKEVSTDKATDADVAAMKRLYASLKIS
jgi:hypothetical protein